jgi:FkbM family methyltransferase
MVDTIRRISIADSEFDLTGDDDYLIQMASPFEPRTIALFRRLVRRDSIVLDIGANIGATCLAFGRLCPVGKVFAFEPSAATCRFLRANVTASGMGHIDVLNVGLGETTAMFDLQVTPNFRAGSFINDHHVPTPPDRQIERVAVDTMDNLFRKHVSTHGGERVDLMKIDVAGYELNVLKGATKVLKRFRPVIVLEMNHWCLNVFQRRSLPEFREALLEIFPYVRAVDGEDVRDLRDDVAALNVMYENTVHNRFMDVVGAFEPSQIERLVGVDQSARVATPEAKAAAPPRPAESEAATSY